MSESAESNGSLVFSMGEFQASFPQDRLYAKNHMWAMPTDAGRFRFGLSAYAVRLLQDVYFLDWIVDAGATIAASENIGSIESKKAESDLYSPLAGRLTAINPEALDDPSAINAEPYGAGWLIEIESDDASRLLDPEAYLKHLDSAWEVAQRTIKGQANQ